jgi:hypothetical protein
VVKGIYNVVFLGGVGVGKSTVIREIFKRLSLNNYYEEAEKQHIPILISPEFTNDEAGMMIFNEYLNRKISETTLFNYIIDFMDNNRPRKPICGAIRLFERCPDDLLFSFVRHWNKDGKISDLAALDLRKRIKKLNPYFPSYSDENTKITCVDTQDLELCLMKIIQIINLDILEFNQHFEDNSYCFKYSMEHHEFTEFIVLSEDDNIVIERAHKGSTFAPFFDDNSLREFNQQYLELASFQKASKFKSQLFESKLKF